MDTYPTLQDLTASGQRGYRARATSLTRILWLLPRLFLPLWVIAIGGLLFTGPADASGALAAGWAAMTGFVVVWSALAGLAALQRRQLPQHFFNVVTDAGVTGSGVTGADCVGSFTTLTEAEQLRDEARAAGADATIVETDGAPYAG